MLFHPVADIFPIDDELVARMTEDIRARGLVHPAWIHRDGSIIDGRHRALACERVGVALRTEVWPGEDRALVAFVVSANLYRRHLTVAQRALVAARIANLLPNGKHPPGSKDPGFGVVSIHEAAALLGVGEASVKRARLVTRRGAPELVQALARGTVKLGAAYTTVRASSLTRVPSRKVVVLDRTLTGVQHRRDQMQTMAAEGYTSDQIGRAVGVSADRVRKLLRLAGIESPADKVAGHRRRLDANRIVETMVVHAESLVADVELIAFEQLDPAQLGDWIVSLVTSKRALELFIRRLQREQQYGQADDACADPVQGATSATGNDANSAGSLDPA